ncbi:MAG: SDR family NAD(P)-dependent oxidoreductase, partial [Chitinophagaceae bacterium]
MQRFKDQVAVVTGGARGIGEGTAKRLLSEGARVVLFDLSQEELDNAVKNFKQEKLQVDSKCLDISNESQVKSAIDWVVKEYGRIDIMINSAGIVGPTATKITDYSFDAFQKVINVNLNGSFLMTKYVMPHMLKQGYGRILLVASIGGKEGNPGMAGYAASKSAVIGLVKGIGKE